MELEALNCALSICKVSEIPADALDGLLCFVGKTDEELSLVCETRFVHAHASAREDGWLALRIVGVLDFSLTGRLASLSAVFAKAGIGIFAVSTYNTDYILVKEGDFEAAQRALELAGHTISFRTLQTE